MALDTHRHSSNRSSDSSTPKGSPNPDSGVRYARTLPAFIQHSGMNRTIFFNLIVRLPCNATSGPVTTIPGNSPSSQSCLCDAPELPGPGLSFMEELALKLSPCIKPLVPIPLNRLVPIAFNSQHPRKSAWLELETPKIHVWFIIHDLEGSSGLSSAPSS